MAQAAPAAKPVQSEGVRPKVPEWIAALGVREKQYYTESKLPAQRILKSQRWPLKARVYLCLRLHTMGFKQELAVKTVKGGDTVPLTPHDIVEECASDRHRVRKVLRELKAEGLCHSEGLRKGAVSLYSWAVPRPPVEPDLGVIYDPQIPDGMPVAVFRQLRRLGVPIPADFEVNRDLPRVLGGLNDYQKVLEGARENLKAAVLGVESARVYKEEVKEEKLNICKELPPPPPPLVDNTTKAEDEEAPTHIKTEETPKPKPPLEEAKAEYPADHWDDAKASQAYREHIKSPTQHKVLIDGIRRHKESERWQDEGGRWIPLASNFIAKRLYEYHPPPKLTMGKRKSKSDVIGELMQAAKSGGAS